MSIKKSMPDEQLMGLVGERLAALRLAKNLTQEQLAEQAGIGRASLQRLESGIAATQLLVFLKVCRALGILERLELLLPEPGPSPMEELKREGQARQRARGRKTGDRKKTNWTWADES